jgi:hypothetical protein
MVRVIIADRLAKEIQRKFKGETHNIVKLLRTLEENPNKGKIVGNVAGILIKELKYKGFRFYFIVEGNKLKVFSKEELEDLLIKFVRMSDKKSQKKVINEIREFLRRIEGEEFNGKKM